MGSGTWYGFLVSSGSPVPFADRLGDTETWQSYGFQHTFRRVLPDQKKHQELLVPKCSPKHWGKEANLCASFVV